MGRVTKPSMAPLSAISKWQSKSNAICKTLTMFGEIDESWPQSVKDRLSELSKTPELFAQRSQAILKTFGREQHHRLLRQAVQARTVAKRIFWLRREADLVVDAAASFSGCSTGCSHCCHIGVTLCEAEAQVIGREIGRVPSRPPEDAELAMDPAQDQVQFGERAMQLVREFKGVRCTFLGLDGRCSIYASRPLACRWQINMDEDGLLCELVPGGAVAVPYLNTQMARAAYVIAFGPAQKMADIRHFFPANSLQDQKNVPESVPGQQ